MVDAVSSGSNASRIKERLDTLCQESLYGLMPYRKMLWDTLRSLDLKAGMKMLDAGCGIGNFELFASEKRIESIEIEAIDPSEHNIAKARTRCGHYKGANFRISDLDKALPYFDNSFDRIICLDTFGSLKDYNTAFAEFSRVLRPDGRLIITQGIDNAKSIQVAKEQIGQIKNVWSRSKKIVDFKRLIPGLIAFRLKASVQGYRLESEIAHGQKEFVPEEDFALLFEDSDYKGVNISSTLADQQYFVHAAKSAEISKNDYYPIIFKAAETDDEFAQMYKLRFKVFCEKKKYLDSGVYPFGIERDEYDTYSQHFIAVIRGEVVGTTRLILNSRLGFPVEKYFGLNVKGIFGCLDKIAEISRMSVLSGRDNTKDPIAFGLYKACYDYSNCHGITHYLAILDSIVLRYYKSVGWTFEPIGESRECLGDITTPYILSLEDTMNNFARMNEKIYGFFSQPFNGSFSDETTRKDNDYSQLRRAN